MRRNLRNLLVLVVVGMVSCAPPTNIPEPEQPLSNHILSDAHYGDLREMIEHFDRKLDDILCKTEQHLLKVRSDINEKLNSHSDRRSEELRNILDDKLQILGLNLQLRLRESSGIPADHEQNNSSGHVGNFFTFSAASKAICSAGNDPHRVLSSLITHRVKRAVTATTRVMEMPDDACSDAEFDVSYPGDDPELLEPRVSYRNPDVCEDGWVVFLRRQDGSVNFTRPWVDYEEGFGDHQGEFWLGNRHLHQLTSDRAHKMRVELTDFSGTVKTADYGHFSVASSSDGYRLTISDFKTGSSAGDGLLPRHNGNMFSTYDRDNDVHADQNCADIYKGGWWYSDCHDVNPTGLYLKPPNGKTNTKGINWKQAYNDRRSFKAVTLKIRPIVH